MKPQTKAVLRILREGGSLTPDKARELVGTDRLAARIREIRMTYGEDYVMTVRERNANGGTHARYYLAQPELFA